MKVIFDNLTPPFFLAHGGAQTQVLQTLEGLRAVGVDVETSRWWDGSQQADLIHCLGTPNRSYLDFAAKKGIPVVSTTLFTATCNRSPRQLSFQGAMISALLALPGIPPWPAIRSQLKWDCYRRCRINVVGIEAEADVLTRVYGVPREQIRIVPLGLADPFLAAGPGPRNEEHLITTGTITERKRSLELARMAIEAQVPVCFVGKPYDRTEPYWKAFEKLIDGRYVRHVSHTESVEEMIRLLQTARGFVLSSDYENRASPPTKPPPAGCRCCCPTSAGAASASATRSATSSRGRTMPTWRHCGPFTTPRRA
jgi:hypothetical protein